MVNFNTAIADKLNGLSQSVLSGHYIFNRELEDAYLAKRFGTPDKFAHNISYEFTTDPESLQQYYNIREFAYKETLGVQGFSGQEDELDKHSYILVVKSGNTVIGGARLTVSSPEKPQIMPLEENGFDIKEHFPQLDFTKLKYCEMSRLALLPEFRNNVIAEQIHKEFVKICERENIDVGFARTTPLQQRRTKTIFKNLGFEMVIRRDIKLDPYEHLEMQFSCVDFTSSHSFVDLLKHSASELVENTDKVVSVEFA